MSSDPSRIARALVEADRHGLLSVAGADELTGFSGEKVIGALQRLAGLLPAAETCYLEVGVFQGLTLLSVAASRPELRCFGIDDFSKFDPDRLNRTLIERRRSRLGADNVELVALDYEAAFASLRRWIGELRIGLYFVDGPHDYRSQRMCLDLALPYLAEDAVIVVDDSNFRHIRQANRDFLLVQPDFRLLFEAYTPCAPAHLSPPEREERRRGWWNGVNVLIRAPGTQLAPSLPPVEGARELFVNDHAIHSSNLGESTPAALDLAQPLVGKLTLAHLRLALRAWRVLARHRARVRHERRFRSSNTYSDALPRTRLHPGVSVD